MVEAREEMLAKGIEKPMVASLAGDVQVEEAAQYLYEHGIPACNFGPGDPTIAHTRDEHVHRSEIDAVHAALLDVLTGE